MIHGTFEIEHAEGEEIDIGILQMLLNSYDLKLKSWAPGSHLIAKGVLLRLKESIQLAIDLAYPETDTDDEE